MALQVVRTLDANLASYCGVVLETCAYAGTGDVLKIQQMLATAGEHIDVDEAAPWKVCGAHTGWRFWSRSCSSCFID